MSITLRRFKSSKTKVNYIKLSFMLFSKIWFACHAALSPATTWTVFVEIHHILLMFCNLKIGSLIIMPLSFFLLAG